MNLPATIHLAFTEGLSGTHIRKWDREPFEGSTAYESAATLTPERIIAWVNDTRTLEELGEVALALQARVGGITAELEQLSEPAGSA